MLLYLSCARPEVLTRAQAYLEKTPGAEALKRERANGPNRAKYEIRLSDAAAEALLNGLLALSPDLDIEATLISDVEGRDHSFWRSTRYQSTIDKSGRRCFEISTDTGWA